MLAELFDRETTANNHNLPRSVNKPYDEMVGRVARGNLTSEFIRWRIF